MALCHTKVSKMPYKKWAISHTVVAKNYMFVAKVWMIAKCQELIHSMVKSLLMC